MKYHDHEIQQDEAERFEEIIHEIDELRKEAMDIAYRSLREHNKERALRGWNASIQTSLNDEHGWIGRSMMDTMHDTHMILIEENEGDEEND